MNLVRAWVLHFLWVLPLVLLLLLFLTRQQRRVMERFAEERLLDRLVPPLNKGRRFLKAFFLLTALALVILALAGPRWGSHYQEVRQKGVDIMVLVDVSPSMTVADVAAEPP